MNHGQWAYAGRDGAALGRSDSVDLYIGLGAISKPT